MATSFAIRLAVGTVSVPVGTSEVPAKGLLRSVSLPGSPCTLPGCLAYSGIKTAFVPKQSAEAAYRPRHIRLPELSGGDPDPTTRDPTHVLAERKVQIGKEMG